MHARPSSGNEHAHCEVDRVAGKVLLQVCTRRTVAHKGQAGVGRQLVQDLPQHLEVLLCADTHTSRALLRSCPHAQQAHEPQSHCLACQRDSFFMLGTVMFRACSRCRCMYACAPGRHTCAQAAHVGKDDRVLLAAAHAFPHGL